MDILLKRLEQSPRLALVARHTRKVLAEESRQRFFAWFTPFNNGKTFVHSPAESSHAMVCRNLFTLLNASWNPGLWIP